MTTKIQLEIVAACHTQVLLTENKSRRRKLERERWSVVQFSWASDIVLIKFIQYFVEISSSHRFFFSLASSSQRVNIEKILFNWPKSAHAAHSHESFRGEHSEKGETRARELTKLAASHFLVSTKEQHRKFMQRNLHLNEATSRGLWAVAARSPDWQSRVAVRKAKNLLAAVLMSYYALEQTAGRSLCLSLVPVKSIRQRAHELQANDAIIDDAKHALSAALLR